MFDIFIDDRKVSYLKRVAHGMPAISFVHTKDEYTRPYDERTAKGWINTLAKYGIEAEKKAR